MASIAKLAAALVVLDGAPNLETLFTMEAQDDREGGEEFIRPGESAKLRDFLVASLLGSANNATISLSRSVEPDAGAFVARMNRKAASLGMAETTFTEPSGLSAENTSTAWDIAKLLAAAGESEVIRESMGTHRATITVHPAGERRTVLTTNHLMGGIVLVAYGKTGHLEESGYNLATAVSTREGRTLYIVTLGSETNEDRIQDAKNLAVWAGNTYAWE
ncbi:MAG: D-alanyl-D-alanine carboxypeptidase [Parcubacteria group bacterium]|nr:D-alanyl-D-alanine carboxypeptidase [Parcubacteria group bacterium]